MPLFTFGIGSKCLGVSEKDSKNSTSSDPEEWIIEFDFICLPKGTGNKFYTLIDFGDFTSAYDFTNHFSHFFQTKVKNMDDNVLRINGYYLRENIVRALLKTPFVN